MGKLRSSLSDRRNLAATLLQNNRAEEARQLLEGICRDDSRDAGSRVMLASILGASGAFSEVETCCREAIGICSDFAEAYYYLGKALKEQGRLRDAVENLHKATHLKKDYSGAYLDLGNALYELMELQKALDCFQRVLEIEPDNAVANYQMGKVFRQRGDIACAVACYKKALIRYPDFVFAQSDMMTAMNYDLGFNRKEIFEAHVKWVQMVNYTSFPVPDFSNTPVHNRRLRVGYISPDFRGHSVAFFIEAVLENHSHSNVETICYADVLYPDGTTQRLSRLSDSWRDIHGLSDSEVCDIIRQDDIDILVDLAGHTLGGRLGVLALKPAPVQVSYLGYPNTTGLAQVDYRLTDKWADPDGGDDYYTEKLVRMSEGFLCYRPPADAPDIAPLPALENGHITFGSFNFLSKVSSETIQLWSEVLNSVPGSHMIVKARALDDADTESYVRKLFAKSGIASDRLDLIGWMESKDRHLAMYNQIDIGLDTFPYNGTTTTCEALWMGVPVLVMSGDRHVSRVGVSIMKSAGCHELIVDSEKEFVAQAISLAGDRERLSELRNNLRNQLGCSSLCDAETYVLSLENAYREMWVHWCDGELN